MATPAPLTPTVPPVAPPAGPTARADRPADTPAAPRIGTPDGDSVVIKAWPDPVIDRIGHDPRSAYVERFWLGILGPSSTWLLRRLCDGLDACPGGYALDVETTAAALGLKASLDPSTPFGRSLERLVRFGMARRIGDGQMVVRRRIPPLTQRQVDRLHPALAAEHNRWAARELRDADQIAERRARRLAMSLVELGEELADVEAQLLRWRYSPALATAASRWAWDRAGKRDET